MLSKQLLVAPESMANDKMDFINKKLCENIRSISELQSKFDKIDLNLSQIVVNKQRETSALKFDDMAVNSNSTATRAKSGKMRNNESKGFFYARPLKTIQHTNYRILKPQNLNKSLVISQAVQGSIFGRKSSTADGLNSHKQNPGNTTQQESNIFIEPTYHLGSMTNNNVGSTPNPDDELLKDILQPSTIAKMTQYQSAHEISAKHKKSSSSRQTNSGLNSQGKTN